MHGEGTPDQLIPSLTNNSAVGAEHANNVVMAISQGIHRETNGVMASMPTFAPQAKRITSSLSPAQVAALTNYVTGQFGKGSSNLTTEDVSIIQQGGQSSFLIRYAAELTRAGIGCGIIILLVILLVVIKKRRKRAK